MSKPTAVDLAKARELLARHEERKDLTEDQRYALMGEVFAEIERQKAIVRREMRELGVTTIEGLHYSAYLNDAGDVVIAARKK